MKVPYQVGPTLPPQLVLVIGTYNEDGSPNAMTAAWGGVVDNDLIILSLDSTHKSAGNILARKAFTIAPAVAANLEAADFVGIVSSNKDPKKMERSGLSPVASEKVDAPYFESMPLIYECVLERVQNDELGFLVFGRVKGVLAESSILDEKNQVDLDRMGGLACFDPFSHSYRVIGEKIAGAFSVGKNLMK